MEGLVRATLTLLSQYQDKWSNRSQHLTQPCYRYPTILGVLAIAMCGDTPVGFQSKKPMESVTENCADRFLAAFSFGQMMSNGVCRWGSNIWVEESKKLVCSQSRITTLSVSTLTLVLVEEGRGDNLRFKDWGVSYHKYATYIGKCGCDMW